MAEDKVGGVDEKKGESAKDRKSLTGMSEKVKATLAPLLGGIRHHPEVEVDLGRESGAATYETVPMGSTPMRRYSTVAETNPSLGKGTSDGNPGFHQDVGLGHRGHHKPDEDSYVLDGSEDPAHRFGITTPPSEGENPFNG